MDKNSIIDEIHAFRDEYAKRFNYDLKAIVRDLREDAKRRGLKLVTLPPKPSTISKPVSEALIDKP